jgi:hypothetical protein
MVPSFIFLYFSFSAFRGTLREQAGANGSSFRGITAAAG